MSDYSKSKYFALEKENMIQVVTQKSENLKKK